MDCFLVPGHGPFSNPWTVSGPWKFSSLCTQLLESFFSGPFSTIVQLSVSLLVNFGSLFRPALRSPVLASSLVLFPACPVLSFPFLHVSSMVPCASQFIRVPALLSTPYSCPFLVHHFCALANSLFPTIPPFPCSVQFSFFMFCSKLRFPALASSSISCPVQHLVYQHGSVPPFPVMFSSPFPHPGQFFISFAAFKRNSQIEETTLHLKGMP